MPHVRSLFTPRRAVGAGVAAVLLATSVTAIASTATAPSGASTVLPSVVPSWAKAATVIGATPADQTVFLLLALRGKDPAGEHAYGVAASTPGNPAYRQWLTKAQFQQRYGAVDGAAEAVTGTLKTLGLTEISTDKLGLTVSARMPVSLAETVFHVGFHQVLHGGESVRVATSEPTLPASLTRYVTGVDGLTEHPVHIDNVKAEQTKVTGVPAVASAKTATNTCVTTVPAGGVPTAYFNPEPSSQAAYGSKLATDKPAYTQFAGDTSTTKPYIVKGYTPAQIRGAYGVNQVKQTGAGVTVGVALFYDGPDVGCDLATFSTQFGLAAPNYVDLGLAQAATTTAAGGVPVLSPADAAGEQTLDVEAIHQMAPDATIDYSGAAAPLDETIYPALDVLIAAGVDQINNSYGGVGDTDDMNAQLFQTAVTDPAMTMGVGLDYSSGDGADEVAAQGVREGDFPSTSDAVTAVGGTGIKIGADDSYGGEFYWGTYSTALSTDGTSWGPLSSQIGGAGGGGGVSTEFAEPTWQQGVVPAEETMDKDDVSTSGVGVSSPGRVTPDVAMIADSTTGLLVGETQQPDLDASGAGTVTPSYSTYRIGGTSVSSPIFTGMMALVDQALGKSAGFINPTIYPLQKVANGAFRDPQVGRSPTGMRAASTAAQVLGGTCTGSTANSDLSCTGTGPGVVPVVTEVRPDYTDSANDGSGIAMTDPTGLEKLPVATGDPNTVVYHLRGQGILGTLEDLPGYDDSTGLGSPCAPQFINDFLPGMASAGSYCTTLPASTVSPTAPVTPAPTPVTVTAKPTNTVATSCTTVRGSALKVYGPKTTALNRHGQAAYEFKLFVNLGKCKTPSAVGRQFFVYVDGRRAATLRTGKNGVQSYLVRLTPGRHTITATFVGNKDLKKSSSSRFSAKAI